MLRWVWANAQTRLSLRYAHTQTLDVDEDWTQSLYL